MSYCPKCGGNGITLEGEICSCQNYIQKFRNFADIEGLQIPGQYQNVHFHEELIPADLPREFGAKLRNLQNDIVSGRVQDMNIFIAAPPKHSKTVFVYSTLQMLYNQRRPVYPFVDMLEVAQLINVEKEIVDVPYLFVRLPVDLSFKTMDTIKLLTDRRLRKGSSSIILISDLPWNYVKAADTKSVITKGDGSYGTYVIYSYFPKEGDK